MNKYNKMILTTGNSSSSSPTEDICFCESEISVRAASMSSPEKFIYLLKIII